MKNLLYIGDALCVVLPFLAIVVAAWIACKLVNDHYQGDEDNQEDYDEDWGDE